MARARRSTRGTSLFSTRLSSPYRLCFLPASVVQHGLVVDVPGRLELEGRVLQVEVPGEALTQTIEYGGSGAVIPQLVGHDDVGAEHGVAARDRPRVQVVAADDAWGLEDVR